MITLTDGQYAITETSEMAIFGMELKNRLLLSDISSIPAGNIVVYAIRNQRYLMFQTLEDLNLEHLSYATLIGYEPGSIAYFADSLSYIPTFRFRDIRLPTKSELEIYLSRKTI